MRARRLLALMNRILQIVILLLCALQTACSLDSGSGARPDILRQNSSITIYRLDGDAGRQPDSDGTFHDWIVTAVRSVTDPAVQRSLLDALRTGIEDPDARASRCFIPRHGIRHCQDDGNTIDYVICFQCALFRSFRDDGPGEGGTIGRSSLQTLMDSLL